MPTYDYECEKCGGKLRRLIGAGAGIILKGAGNTRGEADRPSCGRDRPCCGRGTPCETRSCGPQE